MTNYIIYTSGCVGIIRIPNFLLFLNGKEFPYTRARALVHAINSFPSPGPFHACLILIALSLLARVVDIVSSVIWISVWRDGN